MTITDFSTSTDDAQTPTLPDSKAPEFTGFIPPLDNYSKLPHQFINLLPQFETVAEIKVTLYILRHTWGYNDDSKKLTLDEFMNGRKMRNGKRIDNGTGLAKSSIIDGLRRATEHGFIQIEVDERDLGRVEKFYSLKMADVNQVYELHTAGVQSSYTSGMESVHRTEKETKERKPRKSTRKRTSSKSEEPKPRPRNLYFDAIVDAFGYDPKVTESNAGLIRKVAKELKEANYTPEQIPLIYAYCVRQAKAHNWKPFKAGALSGHADNWRRDYEAHKPKPVASTPRATPPADEPAPLADFMVYDDAGRYVGMYSELQGEGGAA